MEKVSMKIINSEKFKRANISFTGKPSEEIRNELKKEGWLYSKNHNVWYPKNDAAANSLNFANLIREKYFPDDQSEIITEVTIESQKEKLLAMVQSGSSLKDILSKLSDIYGEDAVQEAFNEARTTLSDTDSTPKVNVNPFLNEVDPKSLEIVLYNKNLDNYLFIQSSDEYGWDFTSYDKDYKEIDGGVSDDVPETQYTEDIREAAKSIIKSLYPESDYPDWEQTDLAKFHSKVEEVELPWDENVSPEMEKRIDSGEIFGTNDPDDTSSQKISWVPLHNGRDTDYTYINGHSIERYFIWENENGENEYSVSIDDEDLCFIDDETNEEHKLFFTESELNKQIINDTLYYGNSLDTIHKNASTELTPEDIELCKKVIPPAQFKFTMELTEGEEGEFFKNKMNEIAETYRKINTDSELINKDGTHNMGFRYFLGDTEIFLSEIDSDGIGFGYTILNGDLQMSEWGYTSLEEIMKIPYIKMDYHVPEGITIERMLYQEHSDYFAEYAPKEDLLNVINFSNWTYFNSEKISTKVYDVEISDSLYEQLLPSEYKERSIKEDEVVCIQYRKSVVSEEQDQFLISKFNKNNFMLLQQKEIQIDVELKNKIKSICNSYIEPQNNNSYTNEILDKIKAAGIEVVTDKNEFDRILNTEHSIQKMTSDIEKLNELQKSLDDKKLQEKEIGLAEQAQEQTEKELQEKYFEKFVNIAKEYQEYIPMGQLEKFNWVYYNSQSKQLISDSKMRTENSEGHIAAMNICLFKDISGDLHLGVYEDSNFIESISSIYNLTKENISIPAGHTGQISDRGLTDLNIYLDTFKKFALENDIANTLPAKIISRYESEIKSLETKNAVRINSLKKSQDDYNSYENRISGKSSEKNVFRYKGYTFLPVRYFKPVNEYETVKENLTWEDAIVRIPHTGSDFSINDFFAAADKNGNADIFYCIEKGKFFTLSETGIHSLNDGKRNKELYDSELEEFRSNNAELLSRLNKFEFNEEKDTLLMSNITDVLELGEVFEKQNETLGNVRIRKGTGINANGILHIAERRLEKKILHEHMDVQKAIEETSAILFCAINNIDKKPAVKETNGRWAVYDNGIKTAIDKDKKGYFVVTGFDLDETNQEAAETINAVNARYGYKPEFHEIYAQVGAAYASLRERLAQQMPDVNEQSSSTIQKMTAGENTYGFVHNGKIYLNPEIMNSNASVHEYTHLWDAYTQKTNQELWGKGLKLFKNTKYWNEVISDPNYQDIKDDENLVLSEIHARISGDIAEKVLARIAKLDGEQVKLDAIDWNKEVYFYIREEFELDEKYKSLNFTAMNTTDFLTEFLSTPMKDLIALKNINVPISFNYDEFTKSNFERLVQGYNTSLAVGRDGEGEYYGRLKSGKVHTDIHIREDGIALEHYYPKDGSSYGEYEGENGKFDYENYPGFILREEALKDIDISNCSYDEFISFISKECIDSMKDNEEVFEAAKGSVVAWEDIATANKESIDESYTNNIPEASWDELKTFFGYEQIYRGYFSDIIDEVDREKFNSEKEKKEEACQRFLEELLEWHEFDVSDVSNDNDISDEIVEVRNSILEKISSQIVAKKISSLQSAQDMLDNELLETDLFKNLERLVAQQTEKKYNFFVSDTAMLDLGIGAEFDPIVGMTAEQAAEKYAELKEKGLSPYIGLTIPGDMTFDSNYFHQDLDPHPVEPSGCAIFTETEGKPSFYIGESFVKGLKENDEHAKNVIAAYKELYENADKYILGVEKPNFLFDKEAELNRPAEPLRVYTFSPFGYEGTIVQVETDLRRGIPAYDIVGIADSAVKETRERIRAAFKNSDMELPGERILQLLSPADLRKDSPMDLSMALGILGQTKQYPVNEPVLALGELELSGRIRRVRGAVAAVNSAKAAGIRNIVCDPTTAELLKDIDGIKILTAENLKEANEKLMDAENFQKTEPKLYKAETVQFNEEWLEDYKEALDNLPMDGHFETIRAIEIAVAGKHNILTTGAPGCGKTLLTQTLMPALTPKLTEEESKTITRINSLAGLDSPHHDKLVPPFRMPHQTTTIEGICGGGSNCRPGEISLAHQGTLFMDHAAQFRTSVIQMLRNPLESRQITLSRAGRYTSYPADFQLAMTMNPCPCGCYGSPDKICLDSARSIEMYWKKISDPLLDRIEIKHFVQKDESDTRTVTIEQMKTAIARAFEIQRKRGVYNSHMTPEQIQQYCKMDEEGKAYLDKEEDKLTPRERKNLLKVSLTLANMDGREIIRIKDLKEARELSAPVFEKPKKFTISQNDINETHSRKENNQSADKTSNDVESTVKSFTLRLAETISNINHNSNCINLADMTDDDFACKYNEVLKTFDKAEIALVKDFMKNNFEKNKNLKKAFLQMLKSSNPDCKFKFKISKSKKKIDETYER